MTQLCNFIELNFQRGTRLIPSCTSLKFIIACHSITNLRAGTISDQLNRSIAFENCHLQNVKQIIPNFLIVSIERINY